jgi:hypothetical protein
LRPRKLWGFNPCTPLSNRNTATMPMPCGFPAFSNRNKGRACCGRKSMRSPRAIAIVRFVSPLRGEIAREQIREVCVTGHAVSVVVSRHANSMCCRNTGTGLHGRSAHRYAHQFSGALFGPEHQFRFRVTRWSRSVTPHVDAPGAGACVRPPGLDRDRVRSLDQFRCQHHPTRQVSAGSRSAASGRCSSQYQRPSWPVLRWTL